MILTKFRREGLTEINVMQSAGGFIREIGVVGTIHKKVWSFFPYIWSFAEFIQQLTESAQTKQTLSADMAMFVILTNDCDGQQQLKMWSC